MLNRLLPICSGAALTALTLCLLSAAPAQAADCRVTPDVNASVKSMADNTAMEGHVSIHIHGQPTQAGKSQFDSWDQFKAAFTTWQGYPGPKGPKPAICGTRAAESDCVPEGTLYPKGWPGALPSTCKEVNAAGVCTLSIPFPAGQPIFLSFRYAKNSKGKWILNTAYPSLNSNCS
ncbi:hypothetical protein DB032_12440 [Chromobacterium sp. Panama]|uniref:hypothetical protein n=1 Tax=Chromobacterium sp. Panama TaxID=2161826 RepID=UPI000D2FDAC0|nr:hypothetical protein [Chromobacterium sp. Panama]PTU65688.1 hypothetical protein DB032_12440 [Chromobacterium sp. Panama]